MKKFLKSSNLKIVPPNNNYRFAIIYSRFNEEISKALLDGALRAFSESGISDDFIEIFDVPGAFELPFSAQLLSETQRFDAIVCLGAVIRGETPHFDYVCEGVMKGLMRTQLEIGVPIAMGVLTVETTEQAFVRSGPGNDNKGFEAALVAIEMADFVENNFDPLEL